MARRAKDWNEGLARDLRDPAFAREFLIASLDDGIPLQTALGKVIRAIGVKEFAARVRVASPNVLRAISPATYPPLNPASIFTTVTFAAQLLSMPRRAAMPPKLAP